LNAAKRSTAVVIVVKTIRRSNLNERKPTMEPILYMAFGAAGVVALILRQN